MKYPSYPSYKPSGVEWLGDVPTEWEVKALRYLFQNLDYKRIPVAAKDRADMDKIYPYYGASGVIDYVESYIFSEKLILVAEDGANLLSRSTPLAFIASGYYWVNNHAHILKPIMGDIRFWMCVLQSFDYSPLVTGAAQPKLTADNLGSVKLPVPPIKEQRAIADFLDNQTARIDTLIAKRRALIEKLKEKRSALISRTVTRGLPPAAALAAGLDPHPPLKPSGVEWLGDVPAEWDVTKVKLLEGNDQSVVQTGPFGAQLHASDYVDDGVPLILIRNVNDFKIDDTEIPRISEEDANRLAMYRLQTGDLVFSRVGSIGRIALCTEKEDGWLISGQMLRLRLRNPHINRRYALYILGSEAGLTFVELQSVGSTRESINTDILRNIPILIPPLPEQRAIADFLDRQTAKIDRMVSLEEAVIVRMQEYRSALITAAVTGKIDVRGRAEA